MGQCEKMTDRVGKCEIVQEVIGDCDKRGWGGKTNII